MDLSASDTKEEQGRVEFLDMVLLDPNNDQLLDKALALLRCIRETFPQGEGGRTDDLRDFMNQLPRAPAIRPYVQYQLLAHLLTTKGYHDYVRQRSTKWRFDAFYAETHRVMYEMLHRSESPTTTSGQFSRISSVVAHLIFYWWAHVDRTGHFHVAQRLLPPPNRLLPAPVLDSLCTPLSLTTSSFVKV